jgi:hypothetical protein
MAADRAFVLETTAIMRFLLLSIFHMCSRTRSALTARPSGEHYLRLLERLLALLDAGWGRQRRIS